MVCTGFTLLELKKITKTILTQTMTLRVFGEVEMYGAQIIGKLYAMTLLLQMEMLSKHLKMVGDGRKIA
jgi:hypothetical protein